MFIGGGYGMSKTVFEELEENGIEVDEHLTFYPYRIAFDFEAYFEPFKQGTEKEKITSILKPASVSICSNVPGHTDAVCFISKGDSDDLIARMYTQLQLISETSLRLLLRDFEDVLSQLNQRVEKAKLASQDEQYREQVFSRLHDQLTTWLKRVPVLGFNSGKFDLNLIRDYIFPFLVNSNVKIGDLIKKNSDYLAVSTPDLVFLDIKNYVAAGTSYDKWIRSYDVSQTKGVFPYYWLTCLDKLDETSLPPIDTFWSELKQEGITPDQYETLKATWAEKNMTTMKDFLIWYNNLDVVPFIEAAEKMVEYWRGLNIDPFKGKAISLPGLALVYLTKTMDRHTILPLFPKKHADLYHLMRQNITGGLSIVCHRYHEKGITTLPNGELVDWIYSHDCNSLYLSVLDKPTGTGVYAVWRTEDKAEESLQWKPGPHTTLWNDKRKHNLTMRFQREMSYTMCRKELEWLEWYSHDNSIQVHHRFNGRQKIILDSPSVRYPVDGYIPSSRTVLQFHGCYWHGHGCLRKRDGRATERRAETAKVTARLKDLSYTVIEKWECDWDSQRKDGRIKTFINEHFQLGVRSNILTAKQMTEMVIDGSFFGMVECDIEVPRWDKELIDYFAEFPPICKNVEITINDIGRYMRDFAEDNGYMTQPRKNLINSYWAKKALFATPLLKWYLENGLILTRVYQAIEMKPKRPFSKIVDHIITQRRKADIDESHKSAGENWKTLGNSLYGKTMTNKEKHKNNKIVGDDNVDRLINDPRFCKMEEVGDTSYEISLDKKKIKMDLPLTVAYFVYHYAKLRMLEFVYGFLKKYLRNGSYQIVCSDTDSIIAAYESKDLDALVKPELKQDYETRAKRQFLAHDQFSNRTPGLFKVELNATWIVALCSKTYLAYNDETGSKKYHQRDCQSAPILSQNQILSMY